MIDKNLLSHNQAISVINFRQEDGVPPHSASGSVNGNGELPPLSRTGTPTAADKDILVCYIYLYTIYIF